MSTARMTTVGAGQAVPAGAGCVLPVPGWGADRPAVPGDADSGVEVGS
ncbi:hypothetical protein ACOBQX_08705 [Actinokineospora sp. G85]